MKGRPALTSLALCLAFALLVSFWSLLAPISFGRTIVGFCSAASALCVDEGYYKDQTALASSGYPEYGIGFGALRRIVPILVVLQTVVLGLSRYAARSSRTNYVSKNEARDAVIAILFTGVVIWAVIIHDNFYNAGGELRYVLVGPPLGTFAAALASLFLAAATIVLSAELISRIAAGRRV